MSSSASRNGPCPCGSGKKYKRCCGASAAASPANDELKQKIALAKNALDLGDVARAERALAPLLAMKKPPENALVLAASVAMRAKDFPQARSLMAKVVERTPGNPHYQYNYGTALSICGDKAAAVQAFRRALKLKPDLLVVYPNLGHTLRDLGRSAEAIDCYLEAFRLTGVDTATMSQIVLSMHLFSQADHEQLFAMHCQLGEAIAARNPPHSPLRETLPRRDKIRIAYVSPRFSREIVGYFFKPLFDHHDRERFELYLYNLTPRSDELTAYFAERADAWREAGEWSDAELCRQVVADEIDILVDLAGHAPENRMTAIARKPAPVQVSLLDYFDTTGVKAMDYYVTDHLSTPADSPQRFVEELLFMERPRLVYEAPDYAPAPVFNTDSDKPLVFGSFNRHQKIVPQVVAVWSQLLLAVPGSTLVLKGGAFMEADTRDGFIERFAAHGIEASRIEFRDKSPHAQMFAEYGDIDIALDTFPYNGGLTTCEALWMGTPVLTLEGERIISRQTAGMLAAVGVEGFVAHSLEDFADRGRYWAAHRDELLALRRGLRAQMAASPLTDAAAYTAELEGHYQDIWQRRLEAQ